MPTPATLFLAGLGRSGTTALAELFAAHPRIAVGMERYKHALADPAVTVTREFFDRDRFFDFSDGWTNIRPDVHQRWHDYYAALEEKYDDVDYAGDKITRLAMALIWRSIPEARFVCIVRDVHAVAASWDKRAQNPADTAWSATRGAQTAVRPWNKGLRSVARAHRQRPDQVAILEYDRLYGDASGASARRVLTWLGLEWTDDFGAAFDHAHRQYVDRVAPKERALSAVDAAYVDEHADLALWERVLTRAV